ncbi:MAG: GNVR domain-containing protein [Nostocaceae cyanobacterium]|nr:GNVR domain-containing protein [Nostocaceae cyanobacterium]
MKKIATITARHWKFLLLFNLLVFAGAGGAITTAKRSWTATAKLILPDSNSNLDANLGTLGSLKNSEPNFSAQVNPLKIQAAILTSDALLEKVLAKDPEKDNFTTISQYKSLFKITPQEQSTIIAIEVAGSSPQVARNRTLSLTQAYQERLNQLRQANRVVRQQFSQKELTQAKERLTQAQQRIARFKQSTGLVNSQEQTAGLINSINNLTTQKAQAIAQAQASANRAQVLSSNLNLTPTQAMGSLALGENKNYQFVRNKLAEVDAELVQKRAMFTDAHPVVRNLISQRASLQNQMQQYISQAGNGNTIDTTVSTEGQGRANLIQQLIIAQSEASGLQQQAIKLHSQINELNTILKSLPANQQKLQELERQADVAEGVYKGLVAQIQQTNIDAFDAYPNVQVLDPAKADPKPTSPKNLLTLINAVLASVIGSIALLLLLESRNPLLSPKDLQENKFPIVASIKRCKHSLTPLELSAETELEFHRLASAISLQHLEDRRLLITSATSKEGKTTVTLGLAHALVDLGFRVLLVDGDFRACALSHSMGYTQQWSGKPPVNIQPNLDFLPALPINGKIIELVTRGRFEEALTACEREANYDYVLIDSAPVSFTSETPLMATIIPNILFVVRPGMSHRKSVQESMTTLTQHQAQILGLVVNADETNSGLPPNSLKPNLDTRPIASRKGRTSSHIRDRA